MLYRPNNRVYPSVPQRAATPEAWPTPRRALACLALCFLVGASIGSSVAAAEQAAAASEAGAESEQHAKRVIGATADIIEAASGFRLLARIDTGATSCSIHADQVEVEDEAKKMIDNIGKKVRVQLRDAKGKTAWVETEIADTVRVKTSEEKERRYKVWLTLRHREVERRLHVTLNDRSHMEFPVLIGRNFLCGEFVVDVEKEHSPSDRVDAEDDDDAGSEAADE